MASRLHDAVDAGRPVDTMLRLLREGSAAGLRIVLTGDRSALMGRISSLATQRLVLRMSDPRLCLGGPHSACNSGCHSAGPGISSPDPWKHRSRCSLQTAQDPLRQRPYLLSRVLMWPAPKREPRRSASSPCRPMSASSKLQPPFSVRPPRRTRWALMGVGGDAARPLGVDLRRDGPAFVIAGPPRSGRSSLLAAMASWFSQRNVSIAAVAPQRSRLRDLAGQPGCWRCRMGATWTHFATQPKPVPVPRAAG